MCSDCCPRTPASAYCGEPGGPEHNVGRNLYTPSHRLVDPSVYSTAPDAHPIAGQALEIIFSILEDPSPGLAEVQLRLRRCMAAHPGRPERALLAHLLDTSLRVNANDGNGCPGL
jgi:hypothetical protein